jgi:DNA repair photolyase
MEIGDELTSGARLVGASTELGLRLTFAMADVDVHVEITPAQEEVRHAARTERLLLAYRSAASTHVDSKVGEALCRAVATRIRPNEDRVLAAIARDAAAVAESLDAQTRIREVRVDSLLELAGSPSQRFQTLTPYVGCLIGCRFCYAQERVGTVRRLEGLPQVPWGSFVDVRINAPEILAKELKSAPKAPIKFCPIVSDPYHAIEKRYRVTRGCLEAIRDADDPPPAMVLTRSKLVLRDLDVLTAIPKMSVGVSIPTIDDEVRAHFEPRGASVSDRLSILQAMRDAGVATHAVVQPMLPGSIDALAQRVSSVSIDVLHGVQGASEDFGDPRYASAVDADWQMRQALALRDGLVERGVAVWRGELPPGLG